MNWTCDQIEASLSEHVDGLLDGGAHWAFEQHAHECARCASLITSVSGLVTGLHRLEMIAEPPALAEHILDKTLGRRAKKSKHSNVLDWFRPLMHPRFAYGAASVLVTFGLLIPSLGIDWRKPKLAELRPVNIYRAADREAHLVYARGQKFVSDLRVVYEIQSRLRPDAEPQSPPDSEAQPANPPSPGSTHGPQKNPRGLNRVKEFSPQSALLASALSNVRERSPR